MKIPSLLLLLAALSLSGCVIPYKYTMRQGASGIVRDDASGAPISGAAVVVEVGKERETAKGVTGPDGSFRIPGVSKWGIYIVPMDPMGIAWSLTIRAKGYRDYSSHATTTVMQTSVREVGEIKLKKEEPNQ